MAENVVMTAQHWSWLCKSKIKRELLFANESLCNRKAEPYARPRHTKVCKTRHQPPVKHCISTAALQLQPAGGGKQGRRCITWRVQQRSLQVCLDDVEGVVDCACVMLHRISVLYRAAPASMPAPHENADSNAAYCKEGRGGLRRAA